TTRMAAHAIHTDEGEVFLSVGVESVSRLTAFGHPNIPACRNPRLLPGNGESLADVYIAMGQTAENVAAREEISREEMDQFALRSQQRAGGAQADRFLARETG